MKVMIRFSTFVHILSAVMFVQSRSANRIVKRNELSYRLSSSDEKNDLTSDVIAASTELALESCQKHFKWERWNCPSNSFLSKRSSSLIDREQAFVKAITTASLIYTVMRNCSRENQENCGCKMLREILGHDLTFSLSGCKNSIVKENQRLSKDAQTFANFHNTRVGEIVRKSFCFLPVKLKIL